MNKETTRLVQLYHPVHKRRVALVKEPSLVLLNEITSAYDVALKAIQTRKKLEEYIHSNLSKEEIDYSSVYNGQTEWKLLPAFDHPGGPFGCLVAGTGLTHKNSALSRQSMHLSDKDKLTDSMVMYQWGEEGGFPEKGKIGVQPEWFYKGNGTCLRGHGQTLEVPPYANDGGEEPEVAACLCRRRRRKALADRIYDWQRIFGSCDGKEKLLIPGSFQIKTMFYWTRIGHHE